MADKPEIKVDKSSLAFGALSKENGQAYRDKNIVKETYSFLDCKNNKNIKRKIFRHREFVNGVKKTTLLFSALRRGQKSWSGIPTDKTLRKVLIDNKIFSSSDILI